MAKPAEIFLVNINGAHRRLHAPGSRTLLSILRDDLGLTGAKYGCGKGQCGACTVLVDDRAVRSCTFPVSLAHGRSVTTIEGLARSHRLHRVQEAFLKAQAFQCGYCTPGFIMGIVAFLRKNPDPTELEIRDALAGHLCRCGVYPRIIRAVQLAAAGMRD